jgi:polyvinyl alcohol dehydrogenase (cytochrome)
LLFRRSWPAAVGLAFITSLTFGAPAAFAGSTWTTYHGDMSRSGVDPSEPSLSPVGQAWTAGLDGKAVYGQPVVADGRVFVATEDDDVYGLDAHDGHVLWQHNIGAPLTNVSANVGCGDIDPLGITSTPVIDTATSTLYVVGEISTNGGLPVHRQLVGFNLFTGAQTVSVSADPVLPGAQNEKQIQQRGALALANGRVYVAYGGFDGDCGNYSGWVVGVDETGSRTNVQFDSTPTSSGGAIWEGAGGPSVDPAGDVYVVTGNPNNGSYTAGSYGDSVVKLSPSLGVLAAFRDPHATAGADQDLGVEDALLLPNGDVFTVGKTNYAYLLNSSLGELEAVPGVCGSDPDGGATYDAANNSVYVPCRGGGIRQVILTGSGSLGWKGGGVNGSPELVAGNLWALSYNSGLLEELNASTGSVVQSISGSSIPSFATPTPADGLLIVGTGSGVEAFDGPTGPPPSVANGGYVLAAGDGGVFTYGTAAFHGSLGGHRLDAPIVGVAETPDGGGYWLAGADGGVFTFGDARFYGSAAPYHPRQPIVGLAAAPGGNGYWLVASDGGVFSFGPGAVFHGSAGKVHLAAPVVGMAADSATGGYWLFASDGGVFSYDARFYGSAGAAHLAQPVTGGAAPSGGGGYYLVARDGGVFNYGPAAVFHGSAGAHPPPSPVVGMSVDPLTRGYWLVTAGGSVLAYATATEGDASGRRLAAPVVAISAR